MKKGILIIISLLILSNVGCTQKAQDSPKAQDNPKAQDSPKAPDNYFGLKWGSTIKEAEKVFSIPKPIKGWDDDDEGARVILVDPEGEWKNIGQVKVICYMLLFSKSNGKFFCGKIQFPHGERPNFDIFKMRLTEKYGEPKMKREEYYEWKPENRVEISLNSAWPGSERACVEYRYLPISNEIIAAKVKDVTKPKGKLKELP